MTEPKRTRYVAVITGIICAVAGLAGTVRGLARYMRNDSLESLDLWLKLRRAANILEADLLRIEKLMEQANQSRETLAAAKGMSGSDQMMKWKQNLEADKNEVRQLIEKLPASEEDYHVLTVQVLESTLTEVHRLQVRANELKKRYESALRAGGEERKHLREAAEARVQSARALHHIEDSRQRRKGPVFRRSGSDALFRGAGGEYG